MIKQLLNSAFVSSELHGDLGGCRYPASADNTLLDLHNSSDDTKAEFIDC